MQGEHPHTGVCASSTENRQGSTRSTHQRLPPPSNASRAAEKSFCFPNPPPEDKELVVLKVGNHLPAAGPASPRSIPAPAGRTQLLLVPSGNSQRLQRFEPWRCRGADSSTGSCRQHTCMGWMLHGWGPPGAGGSSQPLPAPKPWEIVGFHQPGGRDCFVGRGTAPLGSSPHQRPELQTIWHTTYLPEPANGRGKPPGAAGRIGAVPTPAVLGATAAVLPVPATPTARVHPSPARRRGRG